MHYIIKLMLSYNLDKCMLQIIKIISNKKNFFYDKNKFKKKISKNFVKEIRAFI